MGAGVLPLLALIGLLMVDLAPAEAAEHRSWEELLERVVSGDGDAAHTGEILWVNWVGGESRAHVADVASGGGELLLRGPGSRMVWLTPDGGLLTDGEGGAELDLPPSRPTRLAPDMMADKYDIEVIGRQSLLDRPATLLEVRRRDGGVLRERLWLDDKSGLLLRRESYDGGTLRRLYTYLSLNLETSASQNPAGSRGLSPGLTRLAPRPGAVEGVAADQLATLRQAGFHVPERLPEGYVVDGIFPGAENRQPLQLIYDDGVYTVSLFQQRGSIDWEALPPGGQTVKALGDRALEWPGAVPRRLVWEAGGITYTLVGDAPPNEFLAIAAGLPHDEANHPWRRFRDGLSRLWSLVSSWS
ncbi:MAG: hypothetical protein GEU81_03970 [Nitriliruptorales bacterium]|nr:hypothetical protein [Nitriliruptorales bacterium]